MDKNREICMQLIALSVAMGTEQKPERIKYYANELMEFDFMEIASAIKKASRVNKFFPQLSEIIELINGPQIPTDELAAIIASEIIEAIHRCGTSSDAREMLGDKFQIVERSGGWESLIRITYAEIPATKAQLRELAKAYINRSKRESVNGDFALDTSPRTIGQKKKGLTLVSFDE